MELNIELLRQMVSTSNLTRPYIIEHFGISDRAASQYMFVVENMETISQLFETDAELVESSVRDRKKQQKLMDINRIERKSFRLNARVENAVSEYVQELIKVFEDNPYKPEGTAHTGASKAVGVIQLSDIHFNELIDLKTNRFDFRVASRRIYKLISEAKTYFKLYGITDVFVLGTGDWMNADRHIDELVAMATNRSKATFISVQILEHALVDLNKDFNVYMAGVCGNETRVGKEYNWFKEIVSDNYDFTIFNVLRYKLKDTKGITFLGLSDKHEEVVEINGKNFLLVHGHQIGKDTSKDISKLVRKYTAMGITVHFIIFGHLHEAMIADTYARSSSVCGSNNYSEDALLLVSRASQNIYLAFENDRIDAIKVDLQDTEGYAGYETHSWEDAYNPKSLEKARKHEVILRITE